MTTKRDYLLHERLRWVEMTRPQMQTRLRKITIPLKLECFIQVATELQALALRDLAMRRADDLGYIVIRQGDSSEVSLSRRRRGRPRPPDEEDVRALRPGVEHQPIPESRLPSPAEVLEDARSRIEGTARAKPPSEEQLEQYREDERVRQGVRKIRFNGIKKEEEEDPHQPRLPGLDEDPPW